MHAMQHTVLLSQQQHQLFKEKNVPFLSCLEYHL